MTNKNLAIKDRFVAAVLAGDQDTVAQLLDPEFELRQPAGLVYAGVYKGAAGFMRFLEAFGAAYEIESLENTNSYVAQDDPDVVVLEFRFRGRVKATGEAFDVNQLEPWYFREGKVRLIRPHWLNKPALPDVA